MHCIPARLRRLASAGAATSLLAALLLSGCATPNRVALTSPPPERMDGIVGLRQQEIASDINRSNLTAAAGGGLLFALIDAGVNNSRAKKAESAASPVRDALIDYQPGEVLAAALREAFGPAEQRAFNQIEIRQITDDKTTKQWIESTGSPALLFIDLGYRLLPGFEGATITATVSLHLKDPNAGAGVAKAGRPAGHYYNEFSSTRRLSNWTAGLQPAEAAKLWADEDGAPAREVLDATLRELAHMIVYDLAQPAPAGKAMYKPSPDQVKRGVRHPTMIQMTMMGHIERQADARVWVRLPAGELCAVHE